MSLLSQFLPGNKFPLVTRTSNVALAAGDLGKLIEITSGTFTQTFASCSSLGDGWFVYLKNSGTGDITLDPSGSETIDGLTSYIMYPGEVRLIQCDGSVLRSVVLNSFYKVFESSGNFVKPPGYRMFEGLLWGAGGSGRRNTDGTTRTGGVGGACAPFKFSYAELAALESVVIGAGGAAQTGPGTDGNDGGTSSFKGVFAGGGFGGSGGNQPGASAYLTSGAGFAQSHVYGALNATNQRGFFGSGVSTNTFTPAPDGSNIYGFSVYGAAAGQSVDGVTPVTKPNSVFGGLGGDVGMPGSAPGGGGGAGTSALPSGAGARGELRIWGVI